MNPHSLLILVCRIELLHETEQASNQLHLFAHTNMRVAQTMHRLCMLLTLLLFTSESSLEAVPDPASATDASTADARPASAAGAD